jgi:hypothetical protein
MRPAFPTGPIWRIPLEGAEPRFFGRLGINLDLGRLKIEPRQSFGRQDSAADSIEHGLARQRRELPGKLGIAAFPSTMASAPLSLIAPDFIFDLADRVSAMKKE